MNSKLTKLFTLGLTISALSTFAGQAAEQMHTEERTNAITHLTEQGMVDPTEAEINESIRLAASASSAYQIVNPSPDQIVESLRLQCLGTYQPRAAEIDESVRLQSAGIINPTLQQINEALAERDGLDK